MSWNLDGKSYGRKDFWTLLINKKQTKPLSECRKTFRLEYEGCYMHESYPIYTTPSGDLFAVILPSR